LVTSRNFKLALSVARITEDACSTAGTPFQSVYVRLFVCIKCIINIFIVIISNSNTF